MENLLSKTISVSEWCNDIIKKQEVEVYTSMTNPRDMNHIVKSAIQEILEYLKSQGKTDMKEVDNLVLKEALNILVPYLKQHEIWKPLKEKPLNDEELEYAFSDLYVDKYVKGDRKYNDPEINGQTYSLFSFTPSSTAKPDNHGLYGFVKVRGTFPRLEEAEEKSKELIQYFSANKIFVCKTGTPIPLQEELNTTENIIEVDDASRDKECVRFQELAKEQGLKEKQAMEEIKQREEQLKRDVERDPNDKEPLQIYLELIHKRATCAYLYTQHKQKLEETKNIILVARKKIADMDEKYPNLQNEYMDHYRESCKKNGIDKAEDEMALYIKRFVGNDSDLGFE
jgi:uncharacterized protein DUF5832